MIKRQLISAALIASMVLGISSPVMADNNVKAQKATIKYEAKKAKEESKAKKKADITKKQEDKKKEQEKKKLALELKKYEHQLSVLKMQLAKAESKLKEAGEAAKQEEVNTVESYEAKVLKLEQKWKAIMEKAAAQDKQELARLDKELADWTAHVEKMKAETAKYITTINEKLKKDIAEIDAKIAAAKTDAEKQALTAAKEAKQKYTALRIEAIEKHLANLNTFWAEKQKSFDLRKDLLLDKQAIDMEYRTKLMEIEKAELAEQKPAENQTTTTTTTTSTTTPALEITPVDDTPAVTITADPAITIERDTDVDAVVSEKIEYNKKIDELKKKIQAVEKIIADLKAKLEKL